MSHTTSQNTDSPELDFRVDEFTRTRVSFWIWCPGQPDVTVTVELRINTHIRRRFKADKFRQDLLLAKVGNGNHAFSIELEPITRAVNPREDLLIELLAINPHKMLIQRKIISGLGLALSSIEENKFSVFRDVVAGAFSNLAPPNHIFDSASMDSPAPKQSAFDIMLEPSLSYLALDTGTSVRAPLSKYADYIRLRYNVDRQFPLHLGQTSVVGYLKWYLESYCLTRGELRAPLGHNEIEYLNEPMIFGNQPFHLSRATYVFLLDNPGLLGSLKLQDQDSYLGIVYWWAIERSRSFFLEDCLVPQSYRDLLESTRPSWEKESFPLSRFMEFYFSRSPEWHFLDLNEERDRALFYVGLMFIALGFPSLLNYVPKKWLSKFTTSDADEGKEFALIAERVTEGATPMTSAEAYTDWMKELGYDVFRRRNLRVSAQGNRVLAASLPRPAASQNPSHIQIIGPMRLASGLGQAARLSACALDAAGCEYSCVTFDLDHPSPAGFSSDIETSDLTLPGVNLIHLNAEMVPLAFAYLPDVFSDAYNIGYFFWELNSPAKCHTLGVELLDEIWVSSQYGVDIYKQATDRPVINVGMAIENAEMIDRHDARRFLMRKVGIEQDEFVFLTTFDSFSFIQRKNPRAVIKAFKMAFGSKEKVRLLIKTHNRNSVADPVQLRIWQAIDEEIGADARIVIMNETLSYRDLLILKSGCDAYVSLHRSEGWGFGMAEAMNLGLPVIATAYSGNLEFCNPETSWLVDYDIVSLGPDEYIFVAPGQQWAEPRVEHAAQQMRDLFNDPKQRLLKAEAALSFIKKHFSPLAVGRRYSTRLQEILKMRGLPHSDPHPTARPAGSGRKSAG